MAKRKRPSWIEQKSIPAVMAVAALTALATMAVKDWLPALASYGWNVATRSKITYVTVAYGDPPNAISSAEVTAHDPATRQKFETTKTDQDGNAVLRATGPESFFVTVSFTSGDKLVRGQKQISIQRYPASVVFNNKNTDITWTTTNLTLGPTNIVAAPAPTVAADVLANDPPWLRFALREVGVKESEGEGSNPRIEEYNASTSIGRLSDKVPWGCSFVSWVLEQAKVAGNIKSARCASWLKFGLPIAEARRGAVAVFSPYIAEASSGFAGFVLGEDDKSVTVVAGNIRNSVALASFPKALVRGYRWPE